MSDDAIVTTVGAWAYWGASRAVAVKNGRGIMPAATVRVLRPIRATIKQAPLATETISYNIPASTQLLMRVK